MQVHSQQTAKNPVVIDILGSNGFYKNYVEKYPKTSPYLKWMKIPLSLLDNGKGYRPHNEEVTTKQRYISIAYSTAMYVFASSILLGSAFAVASTFGPLYFSAVVADSTLFYTATCAKMLGVAVGVFNGLQDKSENMDETWTVANRLKSQGELYACLRLRNRVAVYIYHLSNSVIKAGLVILISSLFPPFAYCAVAGVTYYYTKELACLISRQMNIWLFKPNQANKKFEVKTIKVQKKVDSKNQKAWYSPASIYSYSTNFFKNMWKQGNTALTQYHNDPKVSDGDKIYSGALIRCFGPFMANGWRLAATKWSAGEKVKAVNCAVTGTVLGVCATTVTALSWMGGSSD